MFLMLFTHYLFGYVGTVLCSVGLILALCSVYVFTRRQMRSAVATYLAGLSISDSCLLSLGLIIAINSSIPPKQQSELFYSSHLHKYLFPYVYACIIWFQFTSVWITIGFAIDRWFAIKWPILHYTYSSKRACYIVFTIYCVGFIYSFPRFFEYKTEVQHEKLFLMDNLTEDIEYLVVSNKVLDNRLYHYIVHLILYSVFQSILPLLMLSYFNVELIRSINASSNFLKRFTSLYVQNTRENHSCRYREGSITRSVVCLIGLFILCQVPASILHYIHMFYRNHPVLYICYDISNFLILLNSAVNFFIFTYFNRKFRRELARICIHTKTSRKPTLRTASQQSFRQSQFYPRTPQQNPQLFDIPPGNSWDYPNRSSSRVISQTEMRISNESIDRSRRPSNLSNESNCQRSDSLMHLRRTSAQSIKKPTRYSIYDLECQRSKHHPIRSPHQRARRHSERIAYHRNKPSLTITHHTQHLHYITYNHEKGKPSPPPGFVYTPMGYSSRTTMISSNGIHRTTSECSDLIANNQLVKPIMKTNDKRHHYGRT